MKNVDKPERKPVLIAGFFPPPITGQGLATQRLAELLKDSFRVHTVNLREGELNLDLRVAGRLIQKIRGYRDAGRRLRNAIETHPGATILWTSISPQPIGHLRDLLTIVPTFRSGQRIYAVVHWGRFARLFALPFTRTSARRLVRRLRGVVFLNDYLAEQCAPWIPAEKRYVIPNTLDAEVICTDEEIERKLRRVERRSALRLLFLSHMIREKGYFDVLQAVDILHRRGLPVRATFAGQWLDDADRREFDRFVAHHGLKEIVTHLGSIEHRDRIKSLHLEADVFLLPSYLIEGQPLTILEALNAGNPIITTRIGGTTSMIEDGKEGFFVPPKDPDALADAISRLMDAATWQETSRAARARYLRDYSEAPVLQQWRKLISRMPSAE